MKLLRIHKKFLLMLNAISITPCGDKCTNKP